ncbi:MAG TPA: prephenate dehydratase [Solirubrobacteraceae bacterium]|nr:prephenate dehydratase [Solirubrobacteraceae bacterium]
MRAGFLGPAGTFSEEALLATAPPDTEPVPFATVDAVVRAVAGGEVARGLVPIESATEGSVDATLDALAGAPGVAIAGEVVRPIAHALIASAERPLREIATVASHPQALAQCAEFLRTALPGAAQVAWSSTAEAVREVAARPEPWAAVGTRRAAELYGCAVLRERIEDHPGNVTRFVWLAPAGSEPAAGPPWKTSLLFWGAGDGQPGWLVRCLSEFAFRGVNLTRIESRPRKDRLGRYLFFVDLDGGTGEEPVAAAAEGLRAHCDEVRVLGSYRAA